jgi:hypothetical protein
MRLLASVCALTASFIAGCETAPKAPLTPQEQAGYRAGAPIIAALEAFRETRGHYPARLRELVPHYLPHVHQIERSVSWEDQTGKFQYYPKSNGYTLTFVYYTSSNSHMFCYSPQTRKWEHVVID